jgi:hypothetical protein
MTQPAHAGSGAAIAATPANTAPTSTGAARPAAPDRPVEPAPAGATWPHHFLSLPGIQRWIAGALSPAHGPLTDVDLAEVYEAKTRAVTARFTLHAGTTRHEDVVFKTTLQPLFYYAPAVDRLVMRARPEYVPELLAAEVLAGPTFFDGHPAGGVAPQMIDRQQRRLYSLYRPFTGPLVRALLRATSGGDSSALRAATDAVTAVSRAFARIQVGVAEAPAAVKETIPHLPVRQLPVLYDDLLRRYEEHYLPRFLAGSDEYPDDLPEPRAAFAFLASQRDAVARWTDELAAGDWPDTIDHVDFQPSNAAVTGGGNMVIFDWEESFLACPVFSVVQWMQRTGPCGAAARGAYLDALPWGTRPQRERALELAVLLCDIKNGHTGEVIRDAEGFPGVFSHGALRFIRRTLRSWSTAT